MTHKEPLLRIAKRDSIPRPKAYAIRVIAVLLSLLVSGAFIWVQAEEAGPPSGTL